MLNYKTVIVLKVAQYHLTLAMYRAILHSLFFALHLLSGRKSDLGILACLHFVLLALSLVSVWNRC